MEKKKRLLSIDTFRGLDMSLIMGVEGVILACCALFPNGGESWLATQMHHADWDGLRIIDLVFPIFLFIAGLSFPFSLAKQQAQGRTTGEMHRKIFVRALVLVALGIVYNGFFKLEFPQRYASVLGRIGLAWMLAALLQMHCKTKTRAVIAACILLGYWLLLAFVTAPDAPAGASSLSREGCITGYIDRLLLPGRLHSGDFDPEGLLATLPATVTAMLGMFTGEFIAKEGLEEKKKALWMALAALFLLGAGLLWSLVFPLNKRLWSSSYVLVAGGFSLGVYALIYYMVEVREWTRWTYPLRVIGLNSITIYLIQKIVPMKGVAQFFFGGLAGYLPEAYGNVILAVGYFLVSWLLLYFLDKKNIYLKV